MELIKETGAGVAGANSYADVSDGDTYHEGHLYASAWTGAPVERREAALVMATRLIDAFCEFGGLRASAAQSLQWPRTDCVDRDAAGGLLPAGVLRLGGTAVGGYFDSVSVPSVVVCATCEQARELLSADLTGAPMGDGLVSSSMGGNKLVFDRFNRPPVLTRVVRRLLGKVGTVVGSGCSVRLTRA